MATMDTKGVGPEAEESDVRLVSQFLAKPKMIRIMDHVYCLTHTEVHPNTIDPYGEGYPTCYGELSGGRGVKAADVHRPIYYRARPGDYDEAAG